MKKVFIGFVLCLIPFCAFGQMTTTTIYYNAQGKVIGGTHIKTKPGDSIKITDPDTKNYYVLDAPHIYITAYDRNGKKLWKTDPYMDNQMGEYRTKRPVIVDFKFVTENFSSTKVETISIVYDNTEFGYENLKTGKYHSLGRD